MSVPGADPAALGEHAAALLRELIAVDTTNPPGRETAAAHVLRRYLESVGVACEIVARDPDRANLVARVRGRGTGPSITLLGHTDVVLADRTTWSVPPFAGVERDGAIWGRGALDMKGHAACNAVALGALARAGTAPAGDVVLIAEADEEDGGAQVGLEWLVRERPDLRTDYALNEGGGIRLPLADGRVVYLLGSGEKAEGAVDITVSAAGGHASWPGPGINANVVVGHVLARLEALSFAPVPSAEADGLARLLGVDRPETLVAAAHAAHPFLGSTARTLLRPTLTPTMLAGSAKRNVIPSRSTVTCDMRLCPANDVEDVVGPLTHALDDLDVEIAVGRPPVGGSSSPLDTPLHRACVRALAKLEPGAVLQPVVFSGFTDSHFLREAFGTVAYGFLPLRHTPAAVVADTIHASDERIDVRDLAAGVAFLLDAIVELGRDS